MFKFIKTDGKIAEVYNKKFFEEILKTDAAYCFADVTDAEIKEMAAKIYEGGVKLSKNGERNVKNDEILGCIETVLDKYPEIFNAYQNASEKQTINVQRKQAKAMAEIMKKGDKSNGSINSDLSSTKRALKYDAFERILYKEYVLNKKEQEALEKGYIYIHDMGARRDTINCCLFDMGTVLRDGFEMGDVWYEEPRSLSEAFDVIFETVSK